MRVRIFSVVGESLNFGGRRMETIMRVAWLAAVLLLVLNMATVFAYLSVIYGRIITFSDAQTFVAAQTALQALLAAGWMNSPVEMAMVTLSSLAVQYVLVASFMAPLIRLSGLGEAPAPGVLRLPFGADQLRFIVASLLSFLVMAIFVFGPMAATTYFAIRYVLEAIAEIRFAQFPDPDSLHTINVVAAQQVLFDSAHLRGLTHALPLALAAPFAAGFWALLVMHFHPKNRGDGAGAPNVALRAIGVLAAALAIGALIWLCLLVVAGNVSPTSNLSHLFAIAALAGLIAYYVNLRLAPYVGVAVCRRSLAPGATLRVTRGFNLFRLLAVVILLASVIYVVQALINAVAFPALASTVGSLFAATEVYTRFVNGGEPGDWVRPLFVAIWNGLKIVANIFWTFFSYGVVAGYLGRLYRDSESVDGDPGAAPPWRR